MKTRAGLIAAACFTAALLCLDANAQTGERRTATPAPPSQSADAQPAAADTLVTEVALLRKSLQTLNARLREITDKLLAPDAAQADSSSQNTPNAKQGRLANSLQLLTLAEQRAETMRKELLEMTEKETFYKNRI